MKPVQLVVLATDDDVKATVSLTAVREKAGTDGFGFVVADGYALIAVADKDSQTAASAAAAEAKAGSLAGNARFRDAADRLPTDQTVLAWADLAQLGDLAKLESERLVSEMDQEVPAGVPAGAVGLGLFGPQAAALPRLKGYWIAGAQAVDNGIEIRARGTGLPAGTPVPTDARNELDTLAGNSIAAGVVSGGVASTVTSALMGSGFLNFFGFIPTGGSGSFDPGQTPGIVPGVPPGALPEDFDAKDFDAKEFARAREAAERERKALDDALGHVTAAGFSLSSTPAMPTAAAGPNGEPGVEISDEPPGFLLSFRAADEPAGQALAAALGPLAEDGRYATNRKGNRVELRSKAYTGEGKLADSALYREAMADAVANPAVAGYLDVQRLAGDAPEPAKDWLSPVKAIGLSAGSDGDDLVALVRIVIR